MVFLAGRPVNVYQATDYLDFTNIPNDYSKFRERIKKMYVLLVTVDMTISVTMTDLVTYIIETES